jgi:regulator of protease activity HflC (stomatin/prohibitin superfamily)
MEVTSVQIEDAVFDGDFIQSVKEKVIADQEVEEQRKLIEARRAEKEQITLQAEAERARAAALGLSPQEYLEWLWLQRWDGQLPQTLLSDAAEIILNGAP